MSSQPVVEFLLYQFNAAWARVRGNLEGLTEAEFNWQPSNNVWHLEEREGSWTIPYAWIAPDPVPFTTIAWRMAHLATAKILTVEYAFGAGKKKLADLKLPHDTAGMAKFLAASHAAFVEAVSALTDDDLSQERSTEWGDQRLTYKIVGSAILHDVEHGSAIATLRELYRHGVVAGD